MDVKMIFTAVDNTGGAFTSLENHTRKAGGAFQSLGGTIERTKSQAVEFMKGMLGFEALRKVTGWVRDLAESFVDVASKNERFMVTLTTLYGSVERATEKFKEFQIFIQKTPFTFEQVTDAAIKMKAYGLEPTIGTLTIIGDSVAALGGGADTFSGITRALGQIASKGKLAGQEIRQLAEWGVPAAKILSEELGITVDELDQIGRAAIRSEDALTALLAGMTKRYGGQMKNMQDIWSGIIAEIQDVWRVFVSMVADSGAWAPLKQIFSDLRQWMLAAMDSGKMKQWADNTADVVNATILVFKELSTAAGSAWDVLSSAPMGVIEYFKNLGDAASGAGGKVSNIQATMSDLARLGKNMVQVFSYIGKSIGAIIGVVVTTIKDMVVGIWEALGGIGKALAGAFTFNWGTVRSGLSDVSGAFSGTWKNLGETGKAYFDTIGDSFNDMISGMKRNNGELEQTTTSAVTQVADAIPKITSVAQKASGAIENITESLRKLLGKAKSAREETGKLAGGLAAPSTLGGVVQASEFDRDKGIISLMGGMGEREAMSMLKERLDVVAERVKEIKQSGDPRAYAEEVAWLEERTVQVKAAMSEVVAPRLNLVDMEADLENLKAVFADAGQLITEPLGVQLDPSEALRAIDSIFTSLDRIPNEKVVRIRVVGDSMPSAAGAEVYHSGGVVGGLPRFHSGGVLASDERMIIAQTGERVLSREQNRAYEHGGGQTINFSPSITVNAAQGQDGAALARDLDRTLADMVRSGRSETARALGRA